MLGQDPPSAPTKRSATRAATALLDEAQQAALEHGRAVVAEARAVRRRMLEDADQRRRGLIDELEQLRTTIDETIAALSTPTVDAPAGDARAEGRATSTDDTAPQAAVAGGSSPGKTDPGRIDEVFDQLRADPPPRIAPKHVKATKAKTAKVARPKAAPPKARARAATPAPAEAPPAAAEPAAAAEAAVATLDAPADDGTPAPAGDAPASGATTSELRRRDDLLLPLLPDVLRSAKRLLQDEQNSLLDTVRRTRGKQEANRLLAEPVRQRETWTALLAPSINAAYLGGRAASGKAGRLSRAPDRVVVELAAVLCNPLRERITTTIDAVVAEGPYETDERAAARARRGDRCPLPGVARRRPRGPDPRRARSGVRTRRVRGLGTGGDAPVAARRGRPLPRLRRQRPRAHAQGQAVPHRTDAPTRPPRLSLRRAAGGRGGITAQRNQQAPSVGCGFDARPDG